MSFLNSVSEGQLAEWRARLEAIGQAQVLGRWLALDEGQRRALLAQLEGLRVDGLPRLVARCAMGQAPEDVPPAAESMEPVPVYAVGGDWDRAAFRARGEALLRAGRVAAFTVAGGQGTRLGFDGPKGAFPATPVTGRSLFGVFADGVRATSRRYGASVPWYILTSPLNHAETVAFFEANEHFGLSASSVRFLMQGTLPTLSRDGKLLLAEPGVVATHPDGHGGALLALVRSGALAEMRSKGIEHISYFQVDNPAVRVLDPVFLGLHAAAPDSSAEMSAKMVRKTSPDERVGVFARIDGRTRVVEYSDLPAALAEARTPEGALRFDAANLAVHVIGVDFVERLVEGGELTLPYHRALKACPYVEPETGVAVEPASPNAIKLEMFVFDALPRAESAVVLECDRVEAFAPIKNAEGADSPATSHALQVERAARWLESAGVRVARGADGRPACRLEISPLAALEAADLRERADLPTEILAGERFVLKT